MFRQTALERLSTPERLDELMHVTSPRYWIALLALGGLLVTALIWSGFTTISTTVSGAGAFAGASRTDGGREVIVYVRPQDSGAIRPGMDVRIMESDIRSGQSISLDGKVTSVDQLPASQSSMVQTLRNAGLVQLLTASGRVTPVHVRLIAASRRAGGSTAEAGQQVAPIGATITTSQERVIRMIIP